MKDKTKEKHRYLFPGKIAKKMKTIDTRTQLEATMLSTFLIIIGMFLFIIHQAFYGISGWLFRGMLIFNLLCGVVLLSSSLVTTYQQYVNHLEIMGIDPDEEKKKIKAQGNIFKRIWKICRKKRGKKECNSTVKHNYSPEDLVKLNKIQMLDNMEYSKEILENQGKVDIKPNYEIKKSKIELTIDKSKENVKELIEDQREMLEE